MNRNSKSVGGTRVLVALDGSSTALLALPVARTVAGQIGAATEVLHVTTSDEPPPAAVLGACTDAGCGITIRRGDPAEEILRASRDPAVALVVLTTHAHELERNGRLGSVAEAVVSGCTRPVLFMRPQPGLTPDKTVEPLRRLLLPLDGAPATARPLRPAIEIARRLGAAIDILLVATENHGQQQDSGTLKPPRYVDQPQHEWPQWAAEVVRHVGSGIAGWPSDVPVQVSLMHGDIAESILRFAAAHAVDAVVLVRRSHFEPGRAQILRAVLERAHRPLLLVGGNRHAHRSYRQTAAAGGSTA